jgi:threonine dehydrogenase-like Zn-dependent dehydrogenase
VSEATALWYLAPGEAALRRETLPPPGPDEALVEARYSALSRGTERLVSQGRVPPSQYPVMRAPLMEGDFPFPVKYGYAAVGRVAAGPAALLGQRVFCLHPHQDRFLAPAAMCIPVPDAVPDRRAVLAANMETALNILWDARPLPGERVLVIGAGVVGLLAAWLLSRMPAMGLMLCDIDPRCAALAAALGLPFCRPDDAPGEQELVIHASASEAGLRLALDRAGFEARIIEASWHGDRAIALPLGEGFHARRLQLLSSQVGQVAPAMRGRRSYAERLALALALLADARLDALLAPDTPFATLPAALPTLFAGSGGPPCPVISYD